jgi:hypothetical protein
VSANLKPLRDLIGRHEAGKAHEGQRAPTPYDTVVWFAHRVHPTPRPLTTMTVDQVQAWQGEAIRAYRHRHGTAQGFSAAGRYQIIRRTLTGLEARGAIGGADLFDAAGQDRCCDALIEGRGLKLYLAGDLTAEQFADRLAMEWASFPVTSRQAGQSRIVERGQSYYAGDGVNAAKAKVDDVLAAIDAIKTEVAPSMPETAVASLGDITARLSRLEARMAAVGAAASS